MGHLSPPEVSLLIMLRDIGSAVEVLLPKAVSLQECAQRRIPDEHIEIVNKAGLVWIAPRDDLQFESVFEPGAPPPESHASHGSSDEFSIDNSLMQNPPLAIPDIDAVPIPSSVVGWLRVCYEDLFEQRPITTPGMEMGPGSFQHVHFPGEANRDQQMAYGMATGVPRNPQIHRSTERESWYGWPTPYLYMFNP